jgi:D-cysteine desulfhydrase
VLGHVLAALELEAQLDRAPDAVVVPLGTGGTAAGLVLGLGALGWPTRVVAVRVAPVVVANRWRVALLHRRAAGHLASRGWGPAERRAAALIVIDGSGRGYGHPTPEGVAAQRIAAAGGLLLDGTYGAKAFAALGSLAARGYRRAVFWHTFAPPPPQRPPWDGPEVAS